MATATTEHTHVEGPLCAAWNVETDPLTLQYGGAEEAEPGRDCTHRSCLAVVNEGCVPCMYDAFDAFTAAGGGF